MIKALIFDFDGLILDTENPEYQSWQEIYREHGCFLSLAKWGECIGTANAFDPYAYLEEQSRKAVDRAAIQEKRRAHFSQLMDGQPLLPGVEAYIQDAKRLGLRLGVASSSAHAWVSGHLSRFQIERHFDCLNCSDDVERVKPDPALYLKALERLGVAANEAIAIEDSPNGALAATRAGIFCVTVPNTLTQQLSFSAGDLRLTSLSNLPLEALLDQVNSISGG